MTTLTEKFRKNGYIFFKKMFSPEEVKHYLKIIESMPKIEEPCEELAYAITDGITKLEEFWPVIFQQNLVKTVKEILGPEARYVQHTDLHHNVTSQNKFSGDYRTITGWHRDTRYRGDHLTKREPVKSLEKFLPPHSFLGKVARELFGNVRPIFDETKEPFSIVRAAVYLNSCDEHKAPVYVYPRSHDIRYSASSFERKFFKLVQTLAANFHDRRILVNRPCVRSKPKISLPVKPEPIWHEAGDVLLFDPRLLHSVPTRVGPRSNLFLSYGLENSHTFDYVQYITIERKDMGYRDIDGRLAANLKESDFYLNGVNEFSGGPLTGRF